MIDLNKKYKTQGGTEVVLYEIKLLNACGQTVTYPVKGSILEKGKPPEFCIWSLEGEFDVIWGRSASKNLVEA